MPIQLKSSGLKSEEEWKKQKSDSTNDLTDEQIDATSFIQDRARKAFEQREQEWEYFDGLTFYEDYKLNRQAANTYVRPKKNDDETRINTATTEKKLGVVYNEIRTFNFETEFRAFDQEDNLMLDLGEQFTEVVKRTNQMEKDEDKYSSADREILVQRAVFIEELTTVGSETVRDKRKDQDKPLRYNIHKPQKRIVSGLKMFLGNIYLPWYRFNDQPYIIKYDRIHWKEAETLYKFDEDGKERPMWKHVNKGNEKATQLGGIFNFRFGFIDNDEIEVLTYYSYPDDEHQILLNGVPILPIGTKLPWEYEGYSIRMFIPQEMSLDFAYGKPLVASAKTVQGLENETIRLMVRKFQQALEPPLGVKGNRIFSKDIWSPAAQTQGVSKNTFEKLIDHNGITPSEFSFYQLIKSTAEEMIGAGDLQQGLSQEGDQTKAEIQQQQKNFVIGLGNTIFAVMVMRRDMDFLRLYNLIENSTKPIGKTTDPLTDTVVNLYQKFTTVDSDLGNGIQGTKEIQFLERDLTTTGGIDDNGEVGAIRREEEKLEKKGENRRFFTVNVNLLRQIPLFWYGVVNSTPKDSDQLDKIMFEDAINQAALVSKVSGRPMNGDMWVQRYERTWKMKNAFQKEAPREIAAPDASLGGGNQSVVAKSKPKVENRPTVNTLAS